MKSEAERLRFFPFLPMKKQVHVYFTGRVQGIGFRFTCQDIARGMGITGWVKNLPNGRVEITAESDEEKLSEFISRLKTYFSRHIEDTDINWQGAGGEFKDFGIEF